MANAGRPGPCSNVSRGRVYRCVRGGPRRALLWRQEKLGGSLHLNRPEQQRTAPLQDLRESCGPLAGSPVFSREAIDPDKMKTAGAKSPAKQANLLPTRQS